MLSLSLILATCLEISAAFGLLCRYLCFFDKLHGQSTWIVILIRFDAIQLDDRSQLAIQWRNRHRRRRQQTVHQQNDPAHESGLHHERQRLRRQYGLLYRRRSLRREHRLRRRCCLCIGMDKRWYQHLGLVRWQCTIRCHRQHPRSIRLGKSHRQLPIKLKLHRRHFLQKPANRLRYYFLWSAFPPSIPPFCRCQSYLPY